MLSNINTGAQFVIPAVFGVHIECILITSSFVVIWCSSKAYDKIKTSQGLPEMEAESICIWRLSDMHFVRRIFPDCNTQLARIYRWKKAGWLAMQRADVEDMIWITTRFNFRFIHIP